MTGATGGANGPLPLFSLENPRVRQPDQVTMTLPDGKAMTFTRGVTGGEIAAAIGPGLAKAALIIMVNGQEYDLFRPIEQDAQSASSPRRIPRRWN